MATANSGLNSCVRQHFLGRAGSALIACVENPVLRRGRFFVERTLTIKKTTHKVGGLLLAITLRKGKIG